MKLKNTLTLVAAFFTVSANASPTVAVLGAPDIESWNQDVAAKLMGTGLFSQVDTYDVATSIPSLSTLEQYSAVIAYSDSGFMEGVPLGNELADYVDAGGGVVEAVFANASIPIGGRYSTGGYQGINPTGQTEDIELTLGAINDPGSPIMAGVSSFDGGFSSYHSTGGIINGGHLVASWSDGSPLVVTTAVNGHTTVDLNFFPVSSDARSDFWTSSTDGALLMANALIFAANPVPEPSSLALAGLSGLGLLLCRRRK